MNETPEDIEEKAWMRGNRAAWTTLLGECLRHLGVQEQKAHAWVIEREGAIRVLREICAEYGDNNWPDALMLEDVIEKHLRRHLD